MAGEDTRQELVAAAQRLFALHGVDGPSLREITREAGQRNTSALQYHFGSRDELLRAVLAEHLRDIDSQRMALLDQAALAGGRDLRALAAALVVPEASRLEEPGGRELLQVWAEVLAKPERFGAVVNPSAPSASLVRWSKAVEPLLPEGAAGRPLHRRSAAVRFCASELATRAKVKRRHDHRLFTSHLVDLVAAILGAPVAPETARLIR